MHAIQINCHNDTHTNCYAADTDTFRSDCVCALDPDNRLMPKPERWRGSPVKKTFTVANKTHTYKSVYILNNNTSRILCTTSSDERSVNQGNCTCFACRITK